MATRVSAALAVLVASVAFPLFVSADPPQSSAAGYLLPAGTVVTLVVDHSINSAQIEPGAIVPAHLRDSLELRGHVIARSGEQVHLVVTEVRRAGNGVSGEVIFRVDPIRLTEDLHLPVHLMHSALSPLLVLGNSEDIGVSAKAKAELHQGGELILPAGTTMRARTMETVDASDPNKTILMTPPPYTMSTDRPYSAFTPLPLITYDPAYAPTGRRRRGPTPSPSPNPADTTTPTPTPSPTPT